MRSEACYGNFLVLALIVFFVTPVHMGYTNDTIFYLYLIYAEAVIAISDSSSDAYDAKALSASARLPSTR